MSTVNIEVKLLDDVYAALESVVDQERTTVTDVVNRAVAQYAASANLPFGKRMEIEAADGSRICITRKPA